MLAPALHLPVVLIEERTLLRHLLTQAISAASDRFQLVAAAADGSEGHAACLRHKPALVILGPHLESTDPANLARLLTRQLPRTRLLALADQPDPVALNRLAELGVQGFVDTDQPVEILHEAMTETAAGRPYRTARLQHIHDTLRTHPDSFNRFLTGREQDVFRLVLHGLTSRDAARRLGLTTRSVESIRFRLMRKLGVRNLAGLIDYALRHHLLPGNSTPHSAPSRSR